jgi:dipeptidyl-peptidase-4
MARGASPSRWTLTAVAIATVTAQVQGQSTYGIDDILSPRFPYSLTTAADVDRIAWIEYERGMRNVYTAVPPAYEPTRLTAFLEDDGIDLQSLQVSDDGEIVTFLRGHTRNREGWVANPTSDPRGGERVVWAMSTKGGNPWRVVEARAYSLSSDGRWVLYQQDGQIHRAPVNSVLSRVRGELVTGLVSGRRSGRLREPAW